MRSILLIGVLLIAVGLVVVIVQQFTYTERTHQADVGPIKIQVKDQKTVHVPEWVGILAIVFGSAAVLLAAARKPGRLI